METPFEYPLNPNTPRSSLPFSPAVTFGDLIFVSGQASVDKQGNLVQADFEAEFRLSLQNLKQILEDADSDLSLVVQTRNYVRNPANIPLFNRLYREYFKAPYPARTTITNCLPLTMHYEIECIAVKKQRG